jgi:hypothetical protein
MLNLEFFNPFLRKDENDETMFHYQLVMTGYKNLSDNGNKEEQQKFYLAACEYLAHLKGKIFKEDTSPKLLMPLLHILLYLVTYFRF